MQLNGVQITWFGHATFRIISPQGKIILIDPWTQHNPACPKNLKKVDKVDLMFVTHGHSDHIGDAASIAKATIQPALPSWNWLAGSAPRVSRTLSA